MLDLTTSSGNLMDRAEHQAAARQATVDSLDFERKDSLDWLFL